MCSGGEPADLAPVERGAREHPLAASRPRREEHLRLLATVLHAEPRERIRVGRACATVGQRGGGQVAVDGHGRLPADRQPDQACHVSQIGEDQLLVSFEEQQRAAAPGQFAVFYDGDRCIGGAVIDKAISGREAVRAAV